LRLRAILTGRCPRCLQGPVFPNTLAGIAGITNERCPVCGLVFLRETGYFLGAMYVSYALGVLTVLPVGIFLAVVLEWPVAVVIPLLVLQTVVSMPLFLRFSRMIWLHVDQAVDPR
jgi:uncharacterized protein (DUF983 family)